MSHLKLFLLGTLVFSGIVWGAQQATTPPRPATPTTPTAQQQNRAKVTGTVMNASGQPVRKASVTLLPNNQGNQGNQANQGNNQQNRGGGGGGGRGNQAAQPGQPNNPQPANQTAQPGQAPPRGQQQNQNQQNQQRGGGGGQPRSVTTGDDGVFTFADITPGSYRVRVDRDGFLSQEYGQKSWTGSGVPITLQANQTLSGVNFQLIQGGTIVGRILDENLEPVTGIRVEALTYTYQQGNRTLVPERQVETNDLGEYRLYWLTPGDHFVSALPNSRRGGLVQGNNGGGFQRGGRGGNFGNQEQDNQPDVTYAATFYPGSIDPETAAPVRTGAASEVRGIDFVLRPTPTVRVSGRVIGMDIAPTAQQLQAQQAQQQRGRGGNNAGNNNAAPNNNNNNNNNNGGNRGGRGGNDGGRGGRGPFGGNMQVLLTRTGTSVGGRGGGGGGRGGGGGGRGGIGGIQFISQVNQDGTFLIEDVIPGTYNLIAIQEAQNQVNSTRMRLDVGPGGVEGISLAVRPGVEVPGQIYLEGTPPANFAMNRLRVTLNSQDGLPINSNAQVDDAGKFTLPGVAAMTFRVNLQGLPTGAYLIAGRFGSNDALGEPLSIDQSAPLSLQIGFAPGQIGVTVADSVGQPFSGAITVLIPATRTRTDLYKTGTSDQAGAVMFTGVAPGDYKVLAWEDVPQGAYLNADFLQPYEERAQSVHVDRTGSVSAQVKVIPRNEQ